jgi:hypothetical protein
MYNNTFEYCVPIVWIGASVDAKSHRIDLTRIAL